MRLMVALIVLIAAMPAAAAAQGPLLPQPAPAPPPPATAPPSEPPRIREGVSAGGVDVGGLTVEEATARLRKLLAPRVRRPVRVRVAGRRFGLRARSIRLRLDPPRTARRALKATEPGDVRPFVYFRRRVIRRFVAGVARRVYLAPRNAKLRITVRRMIRRRSYGGRKLNRRGLGKKLVGVLRDPRKPRLVEGRRRRVKPAITYRGLRRRYPTVVTVDRGGFRLRLFKRLRFDRSYPIAVGAAGYDTPTGLFRIISKEVNPAWTAPNRPWAGSYAGKTVPGGAPDNPLKARWLGVTGAVGIHGTSESWSIGSRASRGCIRMHGSDVKDLYRRVPLGTPTLIR